MSTQIVVSGNRILAHGKDCFNAFGDGVFCSNTGRIYEHATAVTVDSVPADIDSVGYEYHAGKFVPCAPFGVGDGTLAVLCGEGCKAIKDSGFAMSDVRQMGKMKVVDYKGGGSSSRSETLPFVPKAILIMAQSHLSQSSAAYAFLCGVVGLSWLFEKDTAVTQCFPLTCEITGTTVKWTASSASGAAARYACNLTNVSYRLIAWG